MARETNNDSPISTSSHTGIYKKMVGNFFNLNNLTNCCMYSVLPKFFKVENFCGSENGYENFPLQNFKFITDSRCGWQLHCKNVLNGIWQNHEIFTPRIF